MGLGDLRGYFGFMLRERAGDALFAILIRAVISEVSLSISFQDGDLFNVPYIPGPHELTFDPQGDMAFPVQRATTGIRDYLLQPYGLRRES